MVKGYWSNGNGKRLQGHPQAVLTTDFIEVWTFRCPDCTEIRDWYLHNAVVQQDGSLRCREHSSIDEDSPPPHWCVQCGEVRPWAPGDYGRRCAACLAPVDRTRSCAQCETDFTPKRSDAVYCSGKCRVAAHRAKR